jgi:DNA polymerase elongation subunit (family B)
MWWLSWLRQLGDTRQRTQLSRVRIRHPHNHLNGARVFDCVPVSYKNKNLSKRGVTARVKNIFKKGKIILIEFGAIKSCVRILEELLE